MLRMGQMGLPVPGNPVKLAPVDAKFELLEPCSGAMVTPGYLRRPDPTVAAFDDDGGIPHRRCRPVGRSERPVCGLGLRRPHRGAVQAGDGHVGVGGDVAASRRSPPVRHHSCATRSCAASTRTRSACCCGPTRPSAARSRAIPPCRPARLASHVLVLDALRQRARRSTTPRTRRAPRAVRGASPCCPARPAVDGAPGDHREGLREPGRRPGPACGRCRPPVRGPRPGDPGVRVL